MALWKSTVKKQWFMFLDDGTENLGCIANVSNISTVYILKPNWLRYGRPRSWLEDNIEIDLRE